MKILFDQDYPEEFYDQPYIKELLDMDNQEYEKIMDPLKMTGPT